MIHCQTGELNQIHAQFKATPASPYRREVYDRLNLVRHRAAIRIIVGLTPYVERNRERCLYYGAIPVFDWLVNEVPDRYQPFRSGSQLLQRVVDSLTGRQLVHESPQANEPQPLQLHKLIIRS
jgi:hypothetical protein